MQKTLQIELQEQREQIANEIMRQITDSSAPYNGAYVLAAAIAARWQGVED